MGRQLHGLKSSPNFDADRRCKRLYCSLTFTCLFLGLPRPALLADEYARVTRHSARLFSYGTLVLDTRIGDIRIEGWDEPRLEVEAETVVRASSEKKAQRLYDRVKIKIEGGDNEVRVRTVYPPRRFWRPFRGESKLSVNFRIKMPFDANLVLTCVDGDVRVRGIVGEERLRVNYGDVEIDAPPVYRLRSLKARACFASVPRALHGGENGGLRPRMTCTKPV